MFQPFKFVGGKYDGDTLPVAEPVPVGLELRVRSIDPSEPSEFYVLGEDGRFHVAPTSHDVSRHPAAPTSKQPHAPRHRLN